MKIIYLLLSNILLFSSLHAENKSDEKWIIYSPENFEQEWEVKQNGFNSRRLSKKAEKNFMTEGESFVVKSEYQSIGKYLCTKRSFSNFALSKL